MNRRAIIIGNDGGIANFLEGVEFDIKNYKSLLAKNEGGAWDDNEVFTFLNDPKKDIKGRILREIEYGCEYMMIIFTGHGYCDEDGEIYFELNPEGEECSLSDIKRWLKSTPCLMIADSCHAIPEGQGMIIESRQRIFSSGGKFWNRKNYKDRYNSVLKLLNRETFVLASSCSFNECSEDTENGGLYSLALFLAANELIKKIHSSEIISIGYVHSMARKSVILQSDGEQTPEINGIYRGRQQPPFLVIL